MLMIQYKQYKQEDTNKKKHNENNATQDRWTGATCKSFAWWDAPGQPCLRKSVCLAMQCHAVITGVISESFIFSHAVIALDHNQS